MSELQHIEQIIEPIVERLVRATLAQMLGVNAPQPEPGVQWEKTAIAEALLKRSPGELNRKRRNGWFREGVHYRSTNTNPNAAGKGVDYEWNVQEVEKELSKARSRRKVK